MTKRFTLFGLIVFYLCTFGFLPYVKAQQYPVQVSTLVNPPFSVFLADYVESGTDRIMVSILPTDVNLNNYKVKLKLVIESLDGSIRVETSPYYNPPPVFLQGSVLEMFTSYELYDLFNFNNLIFKGYSRSEYQQTRRLPEGIYRMGIVVLDYNYAVYEQKEVIVSNYGSSTVNMFLNDPPMLNLPLTDDKIKLFDPQNIVFQWTPRHRGSPNSAFSAEYIFRLYEVWGQHTDANIIVNTQVPIFETTLSNTRMVYGIAEPLLIPGKYYVWNVQAVEQENRSLFRNNGFSEAFSFKYGDECLAPTQLEGFEIRGPGIQVKWKGGSSVTDYNLQYRTKNNTTWYDENTLLSNLSIYDLALGTIYETRVKANCGTYESPYSKSIEIKTKSTADPVFACGNTQVPLPTNTVPQSSLSVGATIMAGGFTCLITEVSGSNGTFTGKCDVTIPFFNYAKVPHTFSQVKINQLNELISGVLLAEMDTANPIMERLDDVYTDDAENGTADIPLDALLDADTAIVVEGTISEISVDPNTGDIIIVTADGETLVVELDDDDTTAVVTDEDGNEYYVADGVVVTGEAALADATGVSTSEVANLDEMRLVLPDIEFIPAELQKYGFDKPIHTELNNSYELIEVRSEPRRIPWKALQTGISEPVDAIIPVSDKYDAQAIGFKTASSRFMSKPTGSQNNKTVNAISVLPGVSETLTAFYSMKDTSGNTVEEELGMLNLVAYDKIIRNVYLVPVNTDVSNTEFEMIKQTLNTSYAQAVSEWSLTLHPRFDVAQSEWDVSPEDEIFQAEDENNRMDYTREQKEIYRAFKSQMDPDNDAWYVFIIPHTTNNTGINGYAIFGKQWVYIYKANAGNDMAHTITHELGHAAFSLRHTFSQENEYIVTQNSTQNLMDYTGGTELNKYQWDYIHNPEFTFAFLQDESEGEMVSIPELLRTIRQANMENKDIVEIMQDGCPENAYKDVPVGNGKLSYFAIHCTDDFETIPIEPKTTSFTDWNINDASNQIRIMPGSKNTVEYETTLGWAKIYQFFEVEDMPPPLDYYESGNLLFEFIILKKDEDQFEKYLYALKGINDISSRYVLFKKDANFRDLNSPYNIINPKTYLDQGREVEIIKNIEEGDKLRVHLKYKGENELYCTATGNLKEIIEVNEDTEYKLRSELKPLKMAFSKSENENLSTDIILKVNYECGEFKHIQTEDGDKLKDLGWVKGSSLKKYVDISKFGKDEFSQKYQQSAETAVNDIIEDWETNEAACNLCVRAALYNLTGDEVLYPAVGSSTTIRDKGDQLFGKVIAGDGSAQGIIDDLEAENLKDYFEEIKKISSETYSEYWERIQGMVDNKVIVIGTYNPGHVFMVVPGGLYEVVDNTEHLVWDKVKKKNVLKDEYQINPVIIEGDKYGYSFAKNDIDYVLRIMDCGKGAKISNGPAYAIMDRAAFKNETTTRTVKLYRYIKK